MENSSPNSSARDIARANRWRRLLLLVLSLVLMIAGGLIGATDLVDAGSRELFAGTLFKVGLVLGLAWLAAPQLERFGWARLRGTGLAVIAAVGALTAIRPRIGAIAAAIVIGGFFALALLGWVRSAIFSVGGGGSITPKTRKIEKNPTRR